MKCIGAQHGTLVLHKRVRRKEREGEGKVQSLIINKVIVHYLLYYYANFVSVVEIR